MSSDKPRHHPYDYPADGWGAAGAPAARRALFIGMGGNFVRAVPDKNRSYEATRQLDLTVGVNTKLDRGHLDHPISRGAVAGYCPEPNALAPLDYHDRLAGTPAGKSIPVRVVS